MKLTYDIKNNIWYKLEIQNKHRLVLKKNHKVIKFNKKVWLQLYININIEPEKGENDFEKDFFFLN